MGLFKLLLDPNAFVEVLDEEMPPSGMSSSYPERLLTVRATFVAFHGMANWVLPLCIPASDVAGWSELALSWRLDKGLEMVA